MSPVGRRPLAARSAAFAAAVLLSAGPLRAGVVEVPSIDAYVGSGVSGAISGAGAPVLAAPVLAPGALAPSVALPLAAPSPAPAAVLSAPAAVPGVPRVAPVFGRRVSPPDAAAPLPSAAAALQPPGPPEEAAAGDQGDAAWARSSSMFDLSAEVSGDAAVTVPEGLPRNNAGKMLARLRKAGELGRAGLSIPGLERARWVERVGGYSGETEKILIDGKPWFLKRLSSSPDPVINETPRATRALNEAGFAAVLRGDPQLAGSFAVSPQVRIFRDGRDVFVLTEGLATDGDGQSRRQELSADQRTDAAIIQLALGMGDMHGGDVLPLGGGRYGLIDFEKLSHEPLTKAAARQIDDEVMLKNFPLVDRLSRNDPALYRARFEQWRAAYAAGGRARIDAALARSGWTPEQRRRYLAAVDTNIETYFERLEPYLKYANDWHEKIRANQAAAARAPPKKKSFLGGLFGP